MGSFNEKTDSFFGKLIFGLIVIGIGMNFLSRTTGLFEFPMSDLWSWVPGLYYIYIYRFKADN
ncbi:hypothetical protein [Natranaerobius thermophilus]|uniref:hypothetical protein n=1 Tax=Natranaerobius thermophilus TaxID=375929 RepID=UPI002F40FA61